MIVKVKSNATCPFAHILYPLKCRSPHKPVGNNLALPIFPMETETQSNEEASEMRVTCVFSVSYATWDCSGAGQRLSVQKPAYGTLQDDGGDRKMGEAQEFKLTSICYLSS